MSDEITITTGARLHFGLLVQGEPERRTYGGAGLMIDQPRYSLTVRRAAADRILATAETAVKVSQFLEQLRSHQPAGKWEIDIREEIPTHAGLGSGTQLGLAMAAAISRLNGESASVTELARRVGRSSRSAIGTIGFASGGLIAHGGRFAEPVRQNFPADWRFVLVTPREHQGLSGELERKAFREMPAMSAAVIRNLSDQQQALMTAATTGDFQTFSRTLFEFGRSVGEYFAPVQGDTFADPRMTALARKLRADGVEGVGQTSWGPTLFALCDGPDSAEFLAGRIRKSPEWSDCEVRIVAATNQGANARAK